MIKVIFSGIGCFLVALCLREYIGNILFILFVILLGFVAYGLSIFFYIKSQGIIGASKTSAFYSVAPFIVAFLSYFLLNETLRGSYFIGLIIMIVRTIIVIIDTLSYKQVDFK